MPRTEYFLFSTPMTGQLRAGTEPYRNTEGAVGNAVISINAKAAGHIAEAVRTGTKPERNIVFSMQDGGIVTDSDTKGYPFTSSQAGKAKAGTTPYTDTVGGAGSGGVTATAAGEGYEFDSGLAGTKPDRAVETAQEVKGIAQTADTDSYQYEVKRCGANRWLSK